MKWLVKLFVCVALFSSTVCSAACPTIAEVRSAQFARAVTVFDMWGVASTPVGDNWLVIALFNQQKAANEEDAIDFAQSQITSAPLNSPTVETDGRGTLCVYTPESAEFLVGAYQGADNLFLKFHTRLRR